MNSLGFQQLNELEQTIHWDDLVETIYPHYVKSIINPTTLTVESMLRIYILGRHFEISPADLEKALLQIEFLREFTLIDLARDSIPNASSIRKFTSLFLEQSLAKKIEQELKIKSTNIKYASAC